jgi:hypothetical protein
VRFVLEEDYVIARDIDASETAEWFDGFEPLGDLLDPYFGIFDGNGFVIRGLFINRDREDYVGLFSAIQSSRTEIRNLHLEEALIYGKYHVGGIGGRLTGQVKNCSVAGVIDGSMYVGALAGSLPYGEVVDCATTGTVRGSYRVGGLIGEIESAAISGSVSGCEVTGDYEAGGFVGRSAGEIRDSRAHGNVIARTGSSRNGGGFAGTNTGTIADCLATGNVIEYGNIAGGFVGASSGDISRSLAIGDTVFTSDLASQQTSSRFGGFAGGSGGTVTECFALGSATSRSRVGGFAGQAAGAIGNSFATGNVTAAITGGPYPSELAGGFAGTALGGPVVDNCYSIGTVAGLSAVGGFLGFNEDGTLNSCFWDVEASGVANSDGGTSATTAQMMQDSTFAGWDFAEVWGIDVGASYPYLRKTGIDVSVEAYSRSVASQVPLKWFIRFDEPVSGFSVEDILLEANGIDLTTRTLTGSGTSYLLSVAGANGEGSITASVPAYRAFWGDIPNRQSQSEAILFDNVAPELSVDAEVTSSTSPAISGTVNDPTASIYVLVDGSSYNAVNHGDGTWSLAAGVIAPPLADGEYDVQATAVDAHRNSAGDATSNELTVDTAPEPTPTATATMTATPTPTTTPTVTMSPSPSPTTTPTLTASPTPTPSPTVVPTASQTSTPTLTVTPTFSPSPTSTPSTPTITLTPSPSATAPPTDSPTPSMTPVETLSPTPSISMTATAVVTTTPTMVITPEPTMTPTATPEVTPKAPPEAWFVM